MDIVNKVTRSRMMAGITGSDTRPELIVRRYLHAAGLRFRLHDSRLPGRPDLVFPRFKTVVFVHGCFWHRHEGCRFATVPATRPSFWAEKFAANVERDQRKEAELSSMGWVSVIIWECETREAEAVDRLFWRVLARSR